MVPPSGASSPPVRRVDGVECVDRLFGSVTTKALVQYAHLTYATALLARLLRGQRCTLAHPAGSLAPTAVVPGRRHGGDPAAPPKTLVGALFAFAGGPSIVDGSRSLLGDPPNPTPLIRPNAHTSEWFMGPTHGGYLTQTQHPL